MKKITKKFIKETMKRFNNPVHHINIFDSGLMADVISISENGTVYKYIFVIDDVDHTIELYVNLMTANIDFSNPILLH